MAIGGHHKVVSVKLWSYPHLSWANILKKKRVKRKKLSRTIRYTKILLFFLYWKYCFFSFFFLSLLAWFLALKHTGDSSNADLPYFFTCKLIPCFLKICTFSKIKLPAKKEKKKGDLLTVRTTCGWHLNRS